MIGSRPPNLKFRIRDAMALIVLCAVVLAGACATSRPPRIPLPAGEQIRLNGLRNGPHDPFWYLKSGDTKGSAHPTTSSQQGP